MRHREKFKRALLRHLGHEKNELPADQQAAKMCDKLWFREGASDDHEAKSLSQHWDMFLGFVAPEFLAIIQDFEKGKQKATQENLGPSSSSFNLLLDLWPTEWFH